MKNEVWRIGLLLAATMTWTAPLFGQLPYDQIVPVRGTPVGGTIMQMSPTEVVIDARGTQRTIAVNEIRRVSFAEEPPELKRGRDQVLTHQYASALADLKKVDPATLQRSEVRQDLQFYLAYSQGRLTLSEGGDKSSAVAAMLQFVRAHPESFHFFQAAELLGDLAVSLGSFENAVKYYKAIATKAPWPDFRMRAVVLEAEARLADRQFAAARDLFASVQEVGIDTSQAARQKRFAEIGRAVCLAELGQPQEGQEILEEMIAENSSEDVELFGRLYNGLGRCYLKAERPKDALLAYLRVDMLFSAEPDVHAESLYHLGKLWPLVKHTERAASARGLLADRYAGSRWAKMD